jgi:hypothetical protein
MLQDINLSSTGIWIAGNPGLHASFGWLVLVLSTLVPISMFVPRYSEFFRGTGLAIFWLAQLSIFFLFNVGLYPLVAVISWLIFIPGHAWNDLLGEPTNFEAVTNSQRLRERRFSMHQVTQMLCLPLFLLVLTTNLIHWQLISFGNLTNQRISQLSQLTMTSPAWKFQQPFSNQLDQKTLRPWFAYPGRLMNGRDIDLLNPHHQDVSEKPSVVADSFPNEHWRRFHLSLWEKRPSEKTRQQISANLLKRLVGNWNTAPRDNSGPIASARLLCIEEVLQQGHVIEIDRQTWAEQ